MRDWDLLLTLCECGCDEFVCGEAMYVKGVTMGAEAAGSISVADRLLSGSIVNNTKVTLEEACSIASFS